MDVRYRVVSLFSGCGGLDLGVLGGFTSLGKKYQKHKFDIVWANDFDKNACDTFRKNIGSHIVCGDIVELLKDKKEFLKLKDIDVVIGGFPCQDFSVAGKRMGAKTKRGKLYKSFVKAVDLLQPKIFLAENVKGLLSIGNGMFMEKIKNDFKSVGYNVEHKLFRVADFGVPQKRERVLMIGVRGGLDNFVFPKPSVKNWIPVGQVIADLEYVPEGLVHNHFWSKARKNKGQGNISINKNDIAPTMRAEHHGNIEYHWNKKRRLSAREVARIQSFPDDFIFLNSTSQAYRQIGNAVPPVMGWYIAMAIEKFLSKSS
ncbi:MAG: DNA cytosine methyltransferase [Candidatus Campbellbacteria bacterium]|nr:DNA cytosine methyltransferase [Candidatus Campbellbacteria bacterium]